MFVILLNYIKPLSEVDRFVPQHIEFLDRYYASGHFQISGRKEPRTGGVILSTAATREEIDNIIEQDPFHRARIAEYEIIEFHPVKTAPSLVHLRAA
jgi:uncharacterized protein YciI